MKAFWMVAPILFSLAGLGAPLPQARAQTRQAEVRVVQCALKVQGMGCQGCAEAVRAALLKIAGVTAAEVDYARGAAKVEYDPAKTSPEKIVAEFNRVGGFRVELDQAKGNNGTQPKHKASSKAKSCCQ